MSRVRVPRDWAHVELATLIHEKGQINGNKEPYLGVRGLQGEQNSCTHTHTHTHTQQRREIAHNLKFHRWFFSDPLPLTQKYPRSVVFRYFHPKKSDSIAHTAAMATFSDDCLPPEGFFEIRNALFELINAYAKPRGYIFTTQRSIHGPSGFSRVFFACDRSCRPLLLPDWDRQRKTITCITNC